MDRGTSQGVGRTLESGHGGDGGGLIRRGSGDTAAAGPSVPWTEKYAPCSPEELGIAVQGKKALEVKDWLEHQLPGSFRREYCRLMVVTGG